MSKPMAPAGSSPAARRLWAYVVGEFELDEHEVALLREAVRTVDMVERLDAIVRAEGVTLASAQGVRAHPALVEVRQQRIALARLLAALRVPSSDESERRPQRRVGVRGVYGVRRVS